MWSRHSHIRSGKASGSLAGLTEGISFPKAVSNYWRRWLLRQMQRQQGKTSRNVKNQGNMTPSEDFNNLPVISPKDMEIWNLPDKEFKVAVLRKLKELQENTKIIQWNQENNTQTKWEFWERHRKRKKEPNRNFEAEEYSELNEKCNKEHQQ